MYTANMQRYERMTYNRVGKSGLKLPAISLVYGTTSVIQIQL